MSAALKCAAFDGLPAICSYAGGGCGGGLVRVAEARDGDWEVDILVELVRWWVGGVLNGWS